ncbi:MAG: universal stress protein [Cellvibrionaceae bacterium]|nr:universal stress protein [Cellvibrionaceae bacterium]
MSFQKILVPIDFSLYSERALQTAVDLFPEGKIYMLYVVESKMDSILAGEVANKFHHDSQDAAHAKLTGLVKGLKAKHNDLEPLIDIGKPVNVILQNCKTLEADLIILGSHGSDGITKAFFGNTTYQVSRRVNCSTLIIR